MGYLGLGRRLWSAWNCAAWLVYNRDIDIRKYLGAEGSWDWALFFFSKLFMNGRI